MKKKYVRRGLKPAVSSPSPSRHYLLNYAVKHFRGICSASSALASVIPRLLDSATHERLHALNYRNASRRKGWSYACKRLIYVNGPISANAVFNHR